MTLTVKRRGRPPKNKVAQPVVVAKTDDQLLDEIKERFEILEILTKGTVAGNVRSTIVSGAPGVGKSNTVYGILNQLNAKHERISGKITAVNLFKAGYRMRSRGSVIVLDDADGVFNEEDALNVLKVLCDSSEYRTVSWMSESSALKDDVHGDVPNKYEFEGSVIFITNLDIQHYITDGKNKYVPHFKALSSRSLYLDLMIHDRQQLIVWVKHVAREGGMFKRQNIDEETGEKFLNYLSKNKNKLRDLSLRTIEKMIDIYRAHGDNWERVFDVLLLDSQFGV